MGATLVIGADLCPIEENRPYFISGDARALFQDLLPHFEHADLVIANLECPLIAARSPIRKTGPTFGEPPECINGIKAAGIDVLCLANNHILDHGEAGLKNTIEVCARMEIDTVGAGRNLGDARRILVRKAGSVRIGVLAVAEREFSIATRDTWGANPLDVIDCVRNIRDHRADFDYLVVLVHGSAEFHVPTPRIREICRFLIEAGANAVIVQHPHTLGGSEKYHSGHIVYGQGALLMDEAIYRNRMSFHEGFLVELRIDDAFQATMELIPFIQSAPAPGARKMSHLEEKEFRRIMAAKSAVVIDDRAVEAAWLQFCRDHQNNYLTGLLGYSRVLRKLNALTPIVPLLHSYKTLMGVRNLVCCETHREALETVLDRFIRERDENVTTLADPAKK
jgi:hypothetical protein